VLAAFLLLRRRWLLLLCSLVAPVAGFIFFFFWLDTPFRILLAEPFRCSTNNVSPGLVYIMAFCEIAMRRPLMFHAVADAFYLAPRSGFEDAVPYLCGIVLAIAIALYFFLRGERDANNSGGEVDGRIYLACLVAASLLCFKHQIYDFLLLIFCLAIALRADRTIARN